MPQLRALRFIVQPFISHGGKAAKAWTELSFDSGFRERTYHCFELLLTSHQAKLDAFCAPISFSGDINMGEAMLVLNWYHPSPSRFPLQKVVKKDRFDVLVARKAEPQKEGWTKFMQASCSYESDPFRFWIR